MKSKNEMLFPHRRGPHSLYVTIFSGCYEICYARYISVTVVTVTIIIILSLILLILNHNIIIVINSILQIIINSLFRHMEESSSGSATGEMGNVMCSSIRNTPPQPGVIALLMDDKV